MKQTLILLFCIFHLTYSKSTKLKRGRRLSCSDYDDGATCTENGCSYNYNPMTSQHTCEEDSGASGTCYEVSGVYDENCYTSYLGGLCVYDMTDFYSSQSACEGNGYTFVTDNTICGSTSYCPNQGTSCSSMSDCFTCQPNDQGVLYCANYGYEQKTCSSDVDCKLPTMDSCVTGGDEWGNENTCESGTSCDSATNALQCLSIKMSGSDQSCCVIKRPDGDSCDDDSQCTSGTCDGMEYTCGLAEGCAVSFATNYDSSANYDDGSCTFGSERIFISAYGEGSTAYRWFTVHNPTDAEVSLYDFHFITVSNGADVDGEAEEHYYFDIPNETPTIPAGGFFTVCDENADSSITDVCDQQVSGGTLSNGDDGMKLVYNKIPTGSSQWYKDKSNYIVLDTLGDFSSTDPGNGWDVCGESEATRDHSLARKPGRTAGETDWDVSIGTTASDCQWFVLPKDDVSAIKAYPYFPESYRTIKVHAPSGGNMECGLHGGYMTDNGDNTYTLILPPNILETYDSNYGWGCILDEIPESLDTVAGNGECDALIASGDVKYIDMGSYGFYSRDLGVSQLSRGGIEITYNSCKNPSTCLTNYNECSHNNAIFCQTDADCNKDTECKDPEADNTGTDNSKTEDNAECEYKTGMMAGLDFTHADLQAPDLSNQAKIDLFDMSSITGLNTVAKKKKSRRKMIRQMFNTNAGGRTVKKFAMKASKLMLDGFKRAPTGDSLIQMVKGEKHASTMGISENTLSFTSHGSTHYTVNGGTETNPSLKICAGEPYWIERAESGHNLQIQGPDGTPTTCSTDFQGSNCYNGGAIFTAGPSDTWKSVRTIASSSDGASSQVEFTVVINVVSLPAGGANWRVFKTTSNGNTQFGATTAFTVGVNTITIGSVDYDRTVKIQLSSTEININSLIVNTIQQLASEMVNELTYTVTSTSPQVWTPSAGSFEYYCVTHSAMKGTIEVVDCYGGLTEVVTDSFGDDNPVYVPLEKDEAVKVKVSLDGSEKVVMMHQISDTKMKVKVDSGTMVVIEDGGSSHVDGGLEITFVGSGGVETGVSGCTAPAANNYDSAATVDDGSCTFNCPCANGVGATDCPSADNSGSDKCTSCTTGYSGVTCTADACTVGADGNACQNGGTATGTTGNCGCDCSGTGFSGTNCQTADFVAADTSAVDGIVVLNGGADVQCDGTEAQDDQGGAASQACAAGYSSDGTPEYPCSGNAVVVPTGNRYNVRDTGDPNIPDASLVSSYYAGGASGSGATGACEDLLLAMKTASGASGSTSTSDATQVAAAMAKFKEITGFDIAAAETINSFWYWNMGYMQGSSNTPNGCVVKINSAGQFQLKVSRGSSQTCDNPTWAYGSYCVDILAPAVCNANGCTCTGGTAATGADCTADGAEICTTCNTGYTKTGDACVADACTAGPGGNPCQNGASITGTTGNCGCSCVAGYSGANCETDIDECASTPCQNSGVCTEGVNSYTCDCSSINFDGTNCEVAYTCDTTIPTGYVKTGGNDWTIENFDIELGCASGYVQVGGPFSISACSSDGGQLQLSGTGQCVSQNIGCTDSTANNYNAAANSDDGSCTYDCTVCADGQPALTCTLAEKDSTNKCEQGGCNEGYVNSGDACKPECPTSFYNPVGSDYSSCVCGNNGELSASQYCYPYDSPLKYGRPACQSKGGLNSEECNCLQSDNGAVGSNTCSSGEFCYDVDTNSATAHECTTIPAVSPEEFIPLDPGEMDVASTATLTVQSVICGAGMMALPKAQTTLEYECVACSRAAYLNKVNDPNGLVPTDVDGVLVLQRDPSYAKGTVHGKCCVNSHHSVCAAMLNEYKLKCEGNSTTKGVGLTCV